MGELTFGGDRRLKSTAEFDAVYGRKISVSDGTIILFARPNGLDRSRIGLSVSKKHGNAPRRNRIKRLLREAFRTARPDLPEGVDFVVVPRPGSTFALDSLRESLFHLTDKVVRRLPPRVEAKA